MQHALKDTNHFYMVDKVQTSCNIILEENIYPLFRKKQTYNWLINNKTIKGDEKFIDTGTCHNAARALVFSPIDYCNALFTCLSAKNTSWLQRLQDSGARVDFAVGRRTETEPLLTTLHWLPVPQRVTFKILLYNV